MAAGIIISGVVAFACKPGFGAMIIMMIMMVVAAGGRARRAGVELEVVRGSHSIE